MKIIYIAIAAGLVLTSSLITPAKAVPVNFQGSLVEALPCTINEGEMIEVDFGDNLIIRNLDGINYSKPIDYRIHCEAAGSVRLTLSGTVSSFDGMALQTSTSGLAIKLTFGSGVTYPLNNIFLDVNLESPPSLRAVPIANPAQLPEPGRFTARATLVAEYQ